MKQDAHIAVYQTDREKATKKNLRDANQKCGEEKEMESECQQNYHISNGHSQGANRRVSDSMCLCFFLSFCKT